MLPLTLMLLTCLRWLSALDEFYRRIFLEAIAFSAVVTAFCTFGYGFLQSVGWPAVSLWSVWAVMGPLWVVGLFVAKRRYQ